MTSRTKFSLQFLGTGNARSKPPANYNTNALVHVDGKRWLIDCGLLCPVALHAMDMSVLDVDGVYISHLHGDHVLGLEEVFCTNYFIKQRRVGLWVPCGLLTAHSGIEGYDIWDNCLRAAMESSIYDEGMLHLLTLADFADVHVMSPGGPENIFGLKAEIFEVTHVPNRPSYGIVLDKRVCFTSDCTFSDTAIANYFENGAEIIFHDVDFEPTVCNSVHASFEELLTLPRDFRERMVLMHYGDDTCAQKLTAARKAGFQIARLGEVFEF